jgi:Xaa-Pro aminopeptidase
MSAQDTKLAATARYLVEQGLDGLIALNGGQNSFLEGHAVYVLSGVRPIGESAVLVDRSGASNLIVTPAWEAERATALSRTRKTIGTNDLAQGLSSALAAHGIDPRKTVTVALSTLGLGLVQAIEAALGGKVLADDKYARKLARIRSPEELAAARKATWIAERGYERFLEFARPGVREF